MATKTIKLREQLHQWVEMQANQHMESLETQLFASLQSGEPTCFTEQDWENLRHLALTGKTGRTGTE